MLVNRRPLTYLEICQMAKNLITQAKIGQVCCLGEEVAATGGSRRECGSRSETRPQRACVKWFLDSETNHARVIDDNKREREDQ